MYYVFSHSVMSHSLQHRGLQQARLPCLKFISIESVRPSNHLIPLSSPSPPAFSCSQLQSFLMKKFFASGGQSIAASLQHHSFQRNPRVDLLQNGLVGSPCSPRDPQESSPTPQFKSINSSALRFLYGSTLTSIHDHRKKHSLDQTDLCWQSNVSAFQYAIQVGHNFSSKE